MNPEQLFELFFNDIREDMNPYFLRRGEGVYHWWRERFMNAYHGEQEPYALRSWAETPQMWLAGYRRAQQEKEAN